jgi:UDP-N-acetylglucosamine 2-epimerase (non-hydrolysing)
MKVMTVVGTRPEIIRLSRVIARIDEFFDQVLVHTGQNWNPKLSDIFFDEMRIRRPELNLDIDVSSLGASIAGVIAGTEAAIKQEKPDAFLVLGDTNSALSLIMAKRMRIPTYHMEAGNRCFDENVPEETNRRIIDHTADFNMVYTEHARRNLLMEGLQPGRILLTGSPMREVLDFYRHDIDASEVLNSLGLEEGAYFIVSAHREETVDNPVRLRSLVDMLDAVADNWNMPVIVSVHPRTRSRIRDLGLSPKNPGVKLLEPFGFFDYNKLQKSAKCALSDSGTISEESAILGFPAVTLRASIERPEALDTGSIIITDIVADQVLAGIALSAGGRSLETPVEYQITNTSYRVAAFIQSTAGMRRRRREFDLGLG